MTTTTTPQGVVFLILQNN